VNIFLFLCFFGSAFKKRCFYGHEAKVISGRKVHKCAHYVLDWSSKAPHSDMTLPKRVTGHPCLFISPRVRHVDPFQARTSIINIFSRPQPCGLSVLCTTGGRCVNPKEIGLEAAMVVQGQRTKKPQTIFVSLAKAKRNASTKEKKKSNFWNNGGVPSFHLCVRPRQNHITFLRLHPPRPFYPWTTRTPPITTPGAFRTLLASSRASSRQFADRGLMLPFPSTQERMQSKHPHHRLMPLTMPTLRAPCRARIRRTLLLLLANSGCC